MERCSLNSYRSSQRINRVAYCLQNDRRDAGRDPCAGRGRWVLAWPRILELLVHHAWLKSASRRRIPCVIHSALISTALYSVVPARRRTSAGLEWPRTALAMLRQGLACKFALQVQPEAREGCHGNCIAVIWASPPRRALNYHGRSSEFTERLGYRARAGALDLVVRRARFPFGGRQPAGNRRAPCTGITLAIRVWCVGEWSSPCRCGGSGRVRHRGRHGSPMNSASIPAVRCCCLGITSTSRWHKTHKKRCAEELAGLLATTWSVGFCGNLRHQLNPWRTRRRGIPHQAIFRL